MKTRLLLVVNVLLIAAVLLSACAPAAAPAPAQAPAQSQPAQAQPTEKPAEAKPTDAPQPTEAPKDTTITIWHQWDGKYLDAITQVFKDYEAAHPGVKIDLSRPEQVQEALQVAVPAGEGPDIIGWANDRIGDQALIGNIVALDDLGMTADALKATYEPAAVSGVTWNGKTWALPESQEGIALIYNKDLIKEEDLPKDLDDLLAKAEAFQKDNSGKVLVCNQGFGASDAYHVAPIYFGAGVPSFVDDQGKAFLNTPEAVKGAEWLSKMAQFSLKENTYDICKAALKEGQAAMWWTGPWAIAGIEADGVNYGILPMGKPFVGIKTLMLSKNAVDRGNQEVALDVMKYFTSPDVQKKLTLVNKTIPAQTAAVNDPEVAKLAAVIGFGKALASGVPMANTPFAGAQWGPVGDASVAVWNGSQAPADAMAAAQKAIEAAIAKMK